MRRHLPLYLMALIALAAAAPDARFDARSGYRNADYRGVVPAPPPGVARIDAAAVAALVDAGRATLIDVVPAEGAVRTADGHWRLAREQRGIAGAAWFPEAGRGAIDPAVERWFLRGVARLHAAAPRATLIVFCLADCLRRAGYRRVRWFAEGVDGWRDLGRPLVPITPYPEPL